MTKDEIKTLAQKLNQEVAVLLNRQPQLITIDTEMNSYRTHGQCQHTRTGITKVRISNSLVHDQDIKEVILHELCHVYAPAHAGHGYGWKVIAEQVGKAYGVSITRCNSREHMNSNGNNGVIGYLVCPCCGAKGAIYGWNNRRILNSTSYYCKKCGRDKTLGKMKLEFTKDK